jgi:hypothetical protein
MAQRLDVRYGKIAHVNEVAFACHVGSGTGGAEDLQWRPMPGRRIYGKGMR